MGPTRQRACCAMMHNSGLLLVATVQNQICDLEVTDQAGVHHCHLLGSLLEQVTISSSLCETATCHELSPHILLEYIVSLCCPCMGLVPGVIPVCR